MAEALGLKMLGEEFQHAIMNETEPSARAIAEVEDDLRSGRAKVLFYNSQVVDLAELLEARSEPACRSWRSQVDARGQDLCRLDADQLDATAKALRRMASAPSPSTVCPCRSGGPDSGR
jgi:zinc/manganese transport system substrate-binding protein